MKVSEFEAKLGTVSDAKLRQMLASSRARGPEVAVQLILAEYRKRGMDDSDAAADHSEAPAAAMATSAYPKEGAGAFGSDAPADAPIDASAPALAPEWLTEETKSGMPIALKAILFLAIVGGILAVAWKFTR